MMQSKSVESRVGYLDSSLMKCLEIGMTMLMSDVTVCDGIRRLVEVDEGAFGVLAVQ
jgi:hypothetical protein